jgi:hypothetical protein
MESTNWKCSYRNCNKDATTEGHVFVKEVEGEALVPKLVLACDTHKKKSGFFEKVSK